MAEYFFGIDIGGTMIKSVIFNNRGNEIAVSAVNTPVEVPSPNYQQRDMEELWQCTANTISDVIKKSGVKPTDIKAVGCTGHGKGLYLWGKDDKPAYYAVASTDRRAAKVIDKWETDDTLLKAKEKILHKPIACQPAAILVWLKDNEPDAYKNIKWIFEAKDYIRFRLTGCAYAERTDYSGAGLLNLKTGEYDKELMEIYGLGELYSALPPLVNSYDNCGYITVDAQLKTGLCKGTPVCGGMFDIDACAIAMDVSNEDKLCVITGTWSINEYISKQPVDGNSTTMNSIFCIPEYYLIEESSPTSAGNLEWVTKALLSTEKTECSIYDYINNAVDNAEINDKIFFLPFLYGCNTKCDLAGILGVDNSSSKADILRAVYEGVAFSHLMHIERLLELREQPEAIRIAGGVTRSDVWLQIFADVIGIPLEVIKAKELGAMGCAMAGAVAAEIYSSYEEAAKNMTRVEKVILPDIQKHEIYVKKYNKYKAITNALGNI